MQSIYAIILEAISALILLMALIAVCWLIGSIFLVYFKRKD